MVLRLLPPGRGESRLFPEGEFDQGEGVEPGSPQLHPPV
jgi:hypothetical protein